MKIKNKLLSIILSFSFLPTIAYANQEPFTILENSTLPRLLRMVELCKENAIDTSYEDININVIKDYIEYGKEIYDIDKNKGEYVKRSLENISVETEKALISYLKGEKEAKNGVKFSGGSVKINGYSMTGDTNQGERPVFFAGYNNARDCVEEISGYGANLFQMEMGPSMYIIEPDNVNWQTTGNTAKYEIVDTDSYTGDKCLRISDVSGDFTLYQDMNLSAGSYALTYYIKGSGTTKGEAKLGTRTGSFSSLTDTWTKKTLNVYVSPAQTVRLSLKVSAGSGELLVDNITVKKSSVNYIINGDFENDFQTVVPLEESKLGVAYAISTNYYDKYIKPAFDKADELGLKVDFIISPHYFPSFVSKSNNIDVTWTNSNFGSMLKYDIFSDAAKETIKEYLKFIVPQIKKRSSLLSICLTNESRFQLAYIDGIFEKHPEIHQKWIAYLEKEYEDIDELNSVYSSSYSDFSDVELNVNSNNVQYYDSMVFNAQMLSEWHEWLTGVVKEYAPEIPVHTKQMYSLSYGDGMHPELAANGGYAELGGYDNYNLYTARKSLNAAFTFNDLIASVSKTPTFNSESHVIYDTGEGHSHYRDEFAKYLRGFLWQGAVHGGTAITLWAIEKSTDKNNIFYDSLGTRPQAVAEAGRTLLDLNRLSPIVSELQNIKADVAILYSDASSVYNTSYQWDVFDIYGKMNNSGQKVEFVSENTIKNGIDLKIIVVPKLTKYLRESTIIALNEYIQNGGCVIAYDGFCQYNEKRKKNSTNIDSNADIISQSEDIYNYYLEKLEELNLDNVVINENTTRASNIDYRSVAVEGNRYVNLCNEKDYERKISLSVDGVSPSYVTDLISGESINAANFIIKPYQPMLLEIKNTTDKKISGFNVVPGLNNGVFSWINNTDQAKTLTLFDASNTVVYTKDIPASDTNITVADLEAETEYKAILSCFESENILSFKTQRNNNTKELIKGWTLEYRGLNPYKFTEGEFKVVSNEAYEGQSSLKLKLYNRWQDMCYYQLWRDVQLKAGTTYRYTLKFKTEDYSIINGGKACFSIFTNDRSNEKQVVIKDESGNVLYPEGEWHEYTFDYTPQTTQNYRLSIIASYGGTLWLDDISVCPLINGAAGENLLKGTADTVGGDFEADEYKTVPELSGEVSAEFYGLNELKIKIPYSEDIKKINIYKEVGGTKQFITSANPENVSIYAKPYSSWSYYISASDANENESSMVPLSGKSMGNISEPFFCYGGNKADYLTEGTLGVMGYAYEDARLWLAVYNDGKLESVESDSGTGWLKAKTYISAENIENKKATVLFWNKTSPLNKKHEIFPNTK